MGEFGSVRKNDDVSQLFSLPNLPNVLKTKCMLVPAFNLRSEKSGAAGNRDLWWTVMIWPLDPFENCLPDVKQRMFRDGNWSGQPVITKFTAEAVKLRAFILTKIYHERTHMLIKEREISLQCCFELLK